jgi:hypothetical protein
MSSFSVRSAARSLAAFAALSLAAAAFPRVAHADLSLFCSAGAPVFGNARVEVSGGSAIHGANGDPTSVRSNAKIVVSGGSTVDGNAISGGAVTVSGGARVTGSIVQNDPTRVAPAPVDGLVAAYQFHNDNHAIPTTRSGKAALDGTNLEVKGGDSLELAAGDYYFTGFRLSGGAVLNVSGEVRIYLPSGKFDLSGGSLAAHAAGASLTVVIAGPGDAKISGGSNFHGALYAPNAAAEVSGNGNSYGGVIAGSFKLTGGSELYAQDVCSGAPPEIPPTLDPGCQGLCPVVGSPN